MAHQIDIASSSINNNNNCHWPIRIGVLLPETYRRQIEPWLALALRHLHQMAATNSSTTILTAPLFLSGGHCCLQLAPKDTKCRASLGMKALFDLIGPGSSGEQHNGEETEWQGQSGNNSNNVFALFGDICTDVNEPVAMASKNWNIVHLSFTETHAKFGTADSNELYSTFFRMAPGERNLNRARNELIRAFGWRRIGSIKQSDHSSLALAHERLTTRLEQNGVQVVYTASLSSESSEKAIGAELDELKARDVHILVADLSLPLALRVFCAAFRHGLYGADFVWIFTGFQTVGFSFNEGMNEGEGGGGHGHGKQQQQNWWRNVDNKVKGGRRDNNNCTVEQLAMVLSGHFALDQAQMRPFEQKQMLVGGRTLGQVLREFDHFCAQMAGLCQMRQNGGQKPLSASSGGASSLLAVAHAAYVYDGIWALALAVNQSLRPQLQNDATKEDDERRRRRKEMRPDRALLLAAMRHTDFEGLSGTYSTLGFLDSANNRFQLFKNNDWSSPPDSTLLLRRREYVLTPLLVLMCVLASGGICLALSFLLINVRFRRHRFIKMSSPNMNNLIICGSLFAYLSIFLLSIDTRLVDVRQFEQICYAKIWILCFGFTLAFGSMFSKTWRVHSIFTNIRRDKKAIRDSKLYLIVAGLLSLDGAVLLLWALVSPFRLALFERGQFREQNRLVIPELERCESEHSLVFQLIFIISKGLLMLFGCFLAWETRAVNVPALNDSKYIGIAVYAVVVMCSVGLALAFILQEHLNEAFMIISFFIIFCTTLTLCLVFVPKVVELWKSPKGSGLESQRNRKGMMKSVIGGKGGGGGNVAGGGGMLASAKSIRHHHQQPPSTQNPSSNNNTNNNAHGTGWGGDNEKTTTTTAGMHHQHQQQEGGMHRQLSLISSEELARRSMQLEADNLGLHQTLVTKSAELWNLLERVKELSDKIKKVEPMSTNGKMTDIKESWLSPSHSDRLLNVPNARGNAGGLSKEHRSGSARFLNTVAEQLRLRRSSKTRNSNRL